MFVKLRLTEKSLYFPFEVTDAVMVLFFIASSKESFCVGRLNVNDAIRNTSESVLIKRIDLESFFCMALRIKEIYRNNDRAKNGYKKGLSTDNYRYDSP